MFLVSLDLVIMFNNWVDLAIIAVLLFFAFEGFGRSLLSELFDLISFILALVLSLQFYNLASRQLENFFSLPHSFANVLGFIIAWFVIETVLLFVSRLILPKVQKHFKVPGEKYLGIVPSLLRGLIFIAIFLVLLATFPVQPRVKKAVNQSRLGSFILAKTYQLETPLKSVFGGFANDTLTFLTVKPQSNERIDVGFKTDKFSYDEAMEFAMIDLVNKERVTRGLVPLKYNPYLREVGRMHSADMFKRGYFSHYSPEGKSVADRAEAQGVDYLVIGENLAFAPNLELAHSGLMNSEGHRANILSPDYHQIGVGAAVSDEYGVMFTQVFRN